MSAANLDAWARHLHEQIDVDRLREELVEGTLVASLDRSASAFPHKTAITVDNRSITFDELKEATASIATHLRSNGLKAGERILLCGTNSLELVIAYLSVLRAAGVAVFANPALTPSEIEFVIAHSDTSTCFVDDSHVSMLRSVGEGMGRTLRFETLKSHHGNPFDVLASNSPDHDLPRVDSQQLALLAFTSGTTGKPKGAPSTHANLQASIRSAMRAWAWAPEDVLVHSLPLSHGHGLSGVHATLIAGSSVVIHSRFEPALLASSIRSNSATVLMSVPAIYQRLVEWEGLDPVDFSSLRLPISGSAPLSPRLASKIAELIGQLPLERYGTTESGLNISNLYEARMPGSIGLPLPGCEVLIIGSDGDAVPDGIDGEILTRGPQIFTGYWGTRNGHSDALEHGWFRTGDIGRIDPVDGRVYITGRSKEMIISGGLNVYPREIELTLEDHASVRQAAVVGAPSDHWGEEVVAFVVADERDAQELSHYLRSRLASYKCPKRIFFVDDFPRNSMGKVVKSELVRNLGA